MKIIDQANSIIGAYRAQGFTLTLRQLYYQFVARDLIANKQTEYKRIGQIINDARLSGLIDWSAIEDRTRYLRTHASWESPEAIISGAADQYREDAWKSQNIRFEVWIEKDALLGVIEPTCNEWRVPYFACRGYASQSELYEAGKRIRRHLVNGLDVVVLHLGDHDPSGLDMTRDITERLEMFSRCDVEVRRIALNFDQIEQYGPPPNPAKETDSRHAAYAAEFGDESWELDALEPSVIANLISEQIEGEIDFDAWNAANCEEQNNREVLSKISSNFVAVSGFVDNME